MGSEATPRFERYSDDIRHAMRIANREAKRHLHPVIDTPHLLIALVKEPTGLAGILLRRWGLTARGVRRAVYRMFKRLWCWNLVEKLPMSPRLEVVVERAGEHAIRDKHDAVGTGGMLLAMLRHDQATTDLLQSMSIDVPNLERSLAKYLHRHMVEAPGQVLYLDSDEGPPAGKP